VCGLIGLALSLPGVTQGSASATDGVVLDRVVAVVNNTTILSSDLENEIHLSVLEPQARAGAKESEADALQRLISRALIRQQMSEEEGQDAMPTGAEVATRMRLLREELPECVRLHCTTEDGWKQFLSEHDLSESEVEDYLRSRLAILHFIELRFRQGIRISHEEIEAYYKDMLLPQYTAGEKPPQLEQVSSRIEEILLQQRVNTLFSDWLENLRKQGQIEILDSDLRTAMSAGAQGTQ